MGLESFGLIKDLVDTNPVGTDPKSQGDDHIRGIKATLKDQFPNLEAAITATAATLNDAATTAQLGRRNLLINGGFDVWQRGTSFTLSTSSRIYAADRWSGFLVSGSGSVSRQEYGYGSGAEPTQSAFFLRATLTGVGATSAFLQQWIEDVRTANARTVTLSGKIKAGAAVQVRPSLQQNFGTGGSASVDVAGGIINATTIWAPFSVTVSLPSVAGKTIGPGSALKVVFFTEATTTATIDFMDIQVEAGTAATPFERLPIGETLALCQRYYEEGTFGYQGYMTAGQAIQLPVRYAVTKRKIPTGADLVITVNGSSNLTNPGNVAYESDGGFSTNGTLTSQGSCYANLTYKANAEL